MKQQVSAPVMATIVVVVIAIVAVIGWKMMQPKADLSTTDRGNSMMEQMKAKYPNMQPPAGIKTGAPAPATKP